MTRRILSNFEKINIPLIFKTVTEMDRNWHLMSAKAATSHRRSTTKEDAMKRMTCMITTVALGILLTACGGGSGSDSERTPQELKAATGNAATVPVAAVAAGPETALYSISLLDTAANSYAVALNDAGQVTGNYLDQNQHLSAFIWQGEKVATVATNGQASRINNHGQIVGWQENSGRSEAFLYEADGRLTRLNTLGGASQALAINDAGQLAGRVTLGADKAFMARQGTMQFIAEEIDGYAIAMNNHGDILIREVSGSRCRTLLLRDGTLTDLGNLGGALTQGRDLNEAGQIVGWAETASGDYHPFLWEDGVMTDLSAYTGSFGAAVAINDAGTILLKASDAGGERNLLLHNGTLTDLGNFGSRYAVANDLNNLGQIVGWMADASGDMHAFLATPKR